MLRMPAAACHLSQGLHVAAWTAIAQGRTCSGLVFLLVHSDSAAAGLTCILPCPTGSGATPEGLRPFLDLLDVETKETTRLWQSSPPYLESLASLLSDRDGQTIRCAPWLCCCAAASVRLGEA